MALTPVKTIQNIAFSTLLDAREQNPSLLFRLNPKVKGDLIPANGYPLPGTKTQVVMSFWDASEIKEGAVPCSLIVNNKKDTILKLQTYNSIRLEQFFQAVREAIPGFVQIGQKPVWQKVYEGSFFRRSIELFLSDERPIIDKMIRERNPEHLAFLDPDVFQEQLEAVQKAPEEAEQNEQSSAETEQNEPEKETETANS